MRYLVDSSAYSLAQKGTEEAMRCFSEADLLVVTPVVLGELRFGFSAGTKVNENKRLLAEFLQSDRAQIVPITEETSHHYAAIRNSLRAAGTPISPNDVWISASAMQHGLTVLTADRDFKKVSQILVELL